MFTIQQGTLQPPITQQSLTDGIKTALIAAGYGGTLYAEFDDGGQKNLVYQVVNDPAKTYGTVYLHLKISADRSVSQRLHTAFDTGMNTGSNLEYIDEFVDDFLNDYQIKWIALTNGTECRWVMLYQLPRWYCLGVLRPVGMPTFWNEDVAPYAIISDTGYSMLGKFHMADITPYFNNEEIRSSLYEPVIPRGRNPFNNQVDIITRLLFSPQSQEGMFGMTSDDIAQATDANLAIGDLVVLPDGKEFFTIATLGGSSPALVVRTA
jgi:hypothetical protein